MDKVFRTIQTESLYIDIHRHHSQLFEIAEDSLEIASIDTQDFNPADKTRGFFTLGIHPWHILRQDIPTALAKIAAQAADPDMLAIGECGLDKAIDTPLPEQLDVFHCQIEMAAQLGKPLIIHCVRAFNELLQCKTNAQTGKSWIVHGFNAHSEMAGQLLNQDFYLCFGKALLHDGSKAAQTLVKTPLEQLFLETDAADVQIKDIYAAATKILGKDVKTLQQQILDNFQRVFLL